jgi:two-component system, cell cycle sensor histidine kinase and response regulator CckA
MLLRILLIDDDAVDRLAVRQALRQTGLQVEVWEAMDGARGLWLFQKEAFDCVLLDYRLPDIDGLEFLHALSGVNSDKCVPIVMLTGLGSEIIAVEAMKRGVHDYLVKESLKPEMLQRAILNAIEIIRLQRDREQAQEALRQQQEWLEVTLASIGDGVITTDTNGVITFMNSVAAALTGWAAQEVLGRHIDDVFRLIHQQTHQPMDSPVPRVLQEERVVELAPQTALITRHGGEIAIADSSAPIRGREGQLRGVVVIFRDVSAHKQMEEELLRARKMESVGVLAGGIAHDFNNLLTGIMGNISLAKMFADMDQRVVKRLTEAEKACQRATALTQQLLTFSTGGAPMRQTVSIAELIRESTIFALRGSNVCAELIIAEDLWPVDADIGQLNQVIQNVVLNATQAMPNGGSVQVQAGNMVVYAGSALPLQEGRYLKITVSDRGCGIPADILPKIFDPYFTTKEYGSGLGLATVYAIIAKHDGYITVESETGVGTTFDIYLPASEHAVQPVPDAPITLNSSTGRVLVMDDEAAIRELLSEMLTTLGYEVECTRHGAEAVAAYQRAQAANQPFAAVILDITVPGGLGGKEAIEHLRALNPQVKALISSGYANNPIMANFAQYGFSGVVTKPYTVERLQQALQRILHGGQG